MSIKFSKMNFFLDFDMKLKAATISNLNVNWNKWTETFSSWFIIAKVSLDFLLESITWIFSIASPKRNITLQWVTFAENYHLTSEKMKARKWKWLSEILKMLTLSAERLLWLRNTGGPNTFKNENISGSDKRIFASMHVPAIVIIY